MKGKEGRGRGREECKREGQEKKGDGRYKELSCEHNSTRRVQLSNQHLQQIILNVEDLPVNPGMPHEDLGTNSIALHFTKLPHTYDNR